MATVTEARTSRKPIRTVRVSVKPTEMNPFTIIVIRDPKHSDHYMVSPIPADFGTAYKVEKFMDMDSPTYHVNVADNDTFTCECKGFGRWNHCKHGEALLALRKAGKL